MAARRWLQRFAPTVTVALPSGTRISGGYERIRLESAIGSGLEQLDVEAALGTPEGRAEPGDAPADDDHLPVVGHAHTVVEYRDPAGAGSLSQASNTMHTLRTR